MSTAKQLRLLNFAQCAFWATASACPWRKIHIENTRRWFASWATWPETERPTGSG